MSSHEDTPRFGDWLRAAQIRQDLSYAIRQLRSNSGLAATTILMLASGIGANTAVFSVFDQIMLQNLAAPEPETTCAPEREIRGRGRVHEFMGG